MFGPSKPLGGVTTAALTRPLSLMLFLYNRVSVDRGCIYYSQPGVECQILLLDASDHMKTIVLRVLGKASPIPQG